MSTFAKARNYELPPGTYTAHVISASWVPQAQDKPPKIQLVFQVVDDPQYQCQRIGLQLTLHEKGMPFARRCFTAVGVPPGTPVRDIPTMQFRGRVQIVVAHRPGFEGRPPYASIIDVRTTTPAAEDQDLAITI